MLRSSHPRRKPQQVHDTPIGVAVVTDGRGSQEHESELKRSPLERPFTYPRRVPLVLQLDGAIGQLERHPQDGVIPDSFRPTLHPVTYSSARIQVVESCPPVRLRKRRDTLLFDVDPLRVSIDELPQSGFQNSCFGVAEPCRFQRTPLFIGP